MTTPLLKEYAEIQKDAECAWGDKTVVFMMVGSFYEVYEIMVGDHTVGRAREVSETCHIVLTRKNKNLEFSPANPWMCGFPLYCRVRYIDRLTSLGYTVVVYDQEEKNPTRRVQRMVCSPMVSSSLMMSSEEEDAMDDAPLTMMTQADRVGFSVYTTAPEKTTGQRVVSIVVVNLTTGVMHLMEKEFAHDKPVRAWLDRALLRHTPVEVCWWVDHARYLVTDVGLYDRVQRECPLEGVLHWHARQCLTATYQYPESQDTLFRRTFGCGHEGLGLERYPMTAAHLARMLDFLHQHHPLLLDRLCSPQWGEATGDVEYLPHTLLEMHLFRGRPSLLEMMDHTCTPMGRRHYRALWFQPRSDTEWLDRCYRQIEDALEDTGALTSLRARLTGFHDWESNLRRLKSGCASARRILWLWRDLEQCQEIFSDDGWVALLVRSLGTRFYRERLEKMEWSVPFVRPEEDEEDGLSDDVDGPRPDLIAPSDPLLITLMERAGVSSDRIIVQESKDDVYVMIRRMPKTLQTLGDGFIMRSMAGNVRIYHAEWTHRRLVQQARAAEQERVHREGFLREAGEWFCTHQDRLERLMGMIIDKDMIASKAWAARDYHLTRPCWEPEEDAPFRAYNLRNPLVEHTSPTRRFVCNDFDLSRHDKTGMVLYGQNSAGKSTYLKSVGMNVWLAQTGHYVFADEMRGRPFHKILTKLTIQDNLFRGMSTFQNEMLDLRDMLARSEDPVSRCLVLTDELTAGTETWSATAIIGTTLYELLQRPHITFVLTTHLHTLQLYKDLYTDPRLQISHVSFSKDGEDDPHYRKILDGEGSVMYGIEIAEQLGFPPPFIARCFHYRETMKRRIDAILFQEEDPQTSASSRYNRRVKRDRCHRCGTTASLHTHHKIPQHMGIDRHGKPVIPGSGGQSMHSAWNLEILCQKCHHKEHAHTSAA